MHLKMSSAVCFSLDQSEILLPGNGLETEVQIDSSKLLWFSGLEIEFF